MHTHGIRFITDPRVTAVMLFMANEIDVMREAMPREPARVLPFSPARNEAARERRQPFVEKYPCYSIPQGSASIVALMRDLRNHKIDEESYVAAITRIRETLRNWGANDERIMAQASLAVDRESE